MAYERLHWVESETPLSADNMNNIEDGIEELQSQKVDKVSGKALSDNNYTSAEKTKLAGIEAGAEVNVQSDWNQSDSSADDYIQNKPVNATSSVAGFMSAADKSKLDGVQAGAQVNRTYTAVTGKPTAAASPAFGGTVTLSQVSQSTTGQVSVTDRVITIPSSDATTSAHGLMSAADKTKLNGIETGATKNTAVATTSAHGLMSSSDKAKLNGIATGAEVNQNAFSNVKVGSTTVAADSKTDTLTLAAGSNVTLTPDATNDKVTIAATDTTYSAATTSAAGLMSAADKTKLNGIEAGANNYSLTKTTTTKKSSSNYVISAGGRGSISFSLSGADKGSLTSVLLKDTEGNRVNLCIIGWEATSSSVTIYVYNPTSQSIQVDGTKSQIVVTTYN